MSKVCFLFGHSYVPESLLPTLEAAIEKCYAEQDIRQFVVGRHGEFDSLARRALISAKRQHEDIKLYLLLHYHPAEHRAEIPAEFDGSIYPIGMETVPRRFAIVEANRRMVKDSDMLICYACHPGNSRELMEYARKHRKVIINTAE